MRLNRELDTNNMTIDLPIVGMVVTISPSFNLYKIVVLPTNNDQHKSKMNGHMFLRTRSIEADH
jgi:hypothetical protein